MRQGKGFYLEGEVHIDREAGVKFIQPVFHTLQSVRGSHLPPPPSQQKDSGIFS